MRIICVGYLGTEYPKQAHKPFFWPSTPKVLTKQVCEVGRTTKSPDKLVCEARQMTKSPPTKSVRRSGRPSPPRASL